MASNRKKVVVKKLERRYEKIQRRLQRISEEAYKLRTAIAQLKDTPKPYETNSNEDTKEPAPVAQ